MDKLLVTNHAAGAVLTLALVFMAGVAVGRATLAKPDPVFTPSTPEVKPEAVPMWYCDGWDGVKYPTEKSMRRAFK